MIKRSALAILMVATITVSLRAADTLRVTTAGPTGQLATIEEANEIRVVFSEPMVTLGRIPDPVTAPFFRITPSIKGTFRWSGTTTLIFTPDPKQKLPFATRYEVVVDGNATSVLGNRLGQSYVFSFTTPTVRLLSTHWYRKNNRFDQSIVIGLRFNQPLYPAAVAGHLKLSYVPHSWDAPTIPASGREWLRKNDPQSLANFDAKVAKVNATVRSSSNVFVFLPTEWEKERLGAGDDLVVVETRPGIPTDAWIRVLLGPELPSPQGKAVYGIAQDYTVQLEPTLFVHGLDCSTSCDPELYNPLRLTRPVMIDEARKKIAARNITDPKKESDPQRDLTSTDGDESYERDQTEHLTLEDLGYQSSPAVTYRLRVDPTLTATDGQTLGYAWVGTLENWHRTAFSSFGDGHGVWEMDGGEVLPFYARNLKSVTQWMAPLTEETLVPTIVAQNQSGFSSPPAVAGTERKLNPTPDKIQSFGLNIKPLLSDRGTGLIWTAIKDGATLPRTARAWDGERARASIVQVTNLGINVKDSPQNVLIFVTSLDTAKPVEGANVTIRTADNRVLWSGVTDANGFALGPKNQLRLGLPPEEQDREAIEQRDPDEERQVWYRWWGFLFVVTAEKDGDFAYVGNDWSEGLDPWSFNVRYEVGEAMPLLRGEVFTDRGVYKPGEEVHFKAIVRTDTPDGMQLLPKGTSVRIVVRNPQAQKVDTRQVTLNEWSAADWKWTVPEGGGLGDYSITARVQGQRNTIWSNFLVAAYRRPDFRVDVTLTGDTAIAGEALDGTVTGRYLFGAPMSNRDARWTFSRSRVYSAPAAVVAKFPEDQYTFVGFDWLSDEYDPGREILSTEETKLDPKGVTTPDLETKADSDVPFDYQLEGEVTDLSRQAIANRASLRVHPAPWYIGISNPPYFADVKDGLDVDIIAVTPEGLIARGVKVTVALQQIQWHSVRRAEGNGFYTWETERKEIDAGTFDVTSGDRPVALHIPIKNGGYYILRATATDDEGRSTRTLTTFYALGGGYTGWERYDHNRIDLVPEKKTLKPGETARIMIKSPWETATAVLTTEREGVRTHQRFELTSTQQTVEVPITEQEIPNVYVSVLLVKGRTKEAVTEDASDPGKPAFRLGYTELRVEDSSKRLNVDVKANREEFRPATKAKVEVMVKDRNGKAAQSEVTLWAVDYGVLSLTAYRTPDILDSIYVPKALQVMNSDSRQKIISRRVITPKGADEGGGGGRDVGDAARRDFRVLAFWVGSLVTDKNGRASTTVTLPESLTTYRIMAVAGDKQSRFGQDESEIRINKPVLLKQTFPRFLAMGDKAYFGGVVHNQMKRGGSATVTIRSLDPSVLEFSGETSKRVQLAAGSSQEVRFDAVPRATGNARIQMTVKLLGESDAFEEVLPVRVLVSPETVAAYGEAKPSAKEIVEIPAGVVPSFGGLQLELSSTALVGLGEGARYLLEYPYGCAEQRASRALALLLASELGGAFQLPGIDPNKTREVAQRALTELEKFQTASGGFAFWSASDFPSPYLTSWVVHVYQRAVKLGYNVSPGVLDRAYVYLENELAVPPPVNEGWWPSYTAWQAFTVKALTEAGRNQDSHLNRLYNYLDRMPVFALSFLYDAMTASGESGPRTAELRRRIFNSILPEGGSAHVEELADPYLLFYWNSNIRSTAIVLGSLVRNANDPAQITNLVRWLMRARKDGRWGNTQENAWAMEALVDYYRKYESETPNFTAIASLAQTAVATEKFEGRSTVAKTAQLPMPQLLKVAPAGQKVDLDFSREGTGTLFYMARLRYAADQLFQTGLDNGFRIERQYTLRGSPDPATSYKAGDLVTVTLTVRNTKERRWVAVTDPLPAGFEPVETAFATTAQDLVEEQGQANSGDWWSWFTNGGFDHVERGDDRVNVFATRLSEGMHVYSYLARATTAGTFRTAPAHVEEMYEPEVFGRTATEIVEVKP